MGNYLADYAETNDARGIMVGLDLVAAQLRVANLIALGEHEQARQELGGF